MGERGSCFWGALRAGWGLLSMLSGPPVWCVEHAPRGDSPTLPAQRPTDGRGTDQPHAVSWAARPVHPLPATASITPAALPAGVLPLLLLPQRDTRYACRACARPRELLPHLLCTARHHT